MKTASILQHGVCNGVPITVIRFDGCTLNSKKSNAQVHVRDFVKQISKRVSHDCFGVHSSPILEKKSLKRKTANHKISKKDTFLRLKNGLQLTHRS
jgi:hypothetical protein